MLQPRNDSNTKEQGSVKANSENKVDAELPLLQVNAPSQLYRSEQLPHEV